MELLTTLLLAHLLADFPLQTDTIALGKATSIRILLLHVLVHVMVLWSLLGFDWATWPLVIGLGTAHLLIDWLKPRLPNSNSARGFLLDQLAHLTSIVLAVIFVETFFHHRLHTPLSATLLYPSLAVGISLALMVFGWIWTNSLQEEVIQQHKHLRWGRESLLAFEQRTGFGLLCVLGVSAFFIR